LDKQIFEIPIADSPGVHIVVYRHLVLSIVEEVIEQMLEICLRRRGGREAADARHEDVHVEHGHLGPGAEGGVEAELCVPPAGADA